MCQILVNIYIAGPNFRLCHHMMLQMLHLKSCQRIQKDKELENKYHLDSEHQNIQSIHLIQLQLTIPNEHLSQQLQMSRARQLSLSNFD